MPGSGPTPEAGGVDRTVARARELFHGRRLDEAEVELRGALDEEPDHPEGRHGLGVVLAAAGRYEECLEQLTLAQRLDPLAEGPYRAMAQLFLMMGEPDKGVRFLERCLDNPALESTPALLMDLVDLHAATDTPDRIAGLLRTVENLMAPEPAEFIDLARWWYELGRSSELARLADRIEPRDTEINAGVIAVLAGLSAALSGDPSAAATHYRQALQALPDVWLIPERLASLLVGHPELGDAQAARAAVERAQSIAPKEPDVRIAAAIVHWRLDGDEEAKEALEIAAQQEGLRTTLRRRAQAALAAAAGP